MLFSLLFSLWLYEKPDELLTSPNTFHPNMLFRLTIHPLAQKLRLRCENYTSGNWLFTRQLHASLTIQNFPTVISHVHTLSKTEK